MIRPAPKIGKGAKDMAHIKSVRFYNVGKAEGCTCERCGQYITNIWAVTFTEGMTLNYGIDCFKKIQRTGFNATAIKAINKALKSIQAYEEAHERFISGDRNEDNDESYKYEQTDKHNAWYGEPYEKYKSWFVNEFFPYRISEENKIIAKYSKINLQIEA